MRKIAVIAAAASIAGAAHARDEAPGPASPPPSVESAVTLPANTEVAVHLVEPLTSRTARQGHRFTVAVSRDVLVGQAVAIPRGTPGVGEVTWRTGRGAYGKSAKMEIAVTSLNVNGRVVPVSGKARQEGRGATAATLGTIFFGGLVAGAFVTGRSANFEQGHELRAYTTEAVAMAPVGPVFSPRPPVVAAAPSAPVVAVAARFERPAVDAPAGRPAPAAADRSGPHARLLAAQRGVRGYEPRQGWTITD